jgi:hypothetical protein
LVVVSVVANTTVLLRKFFFLWCLCAFRAPLHLNKFVNYSMPQLTKELKLAVLIDADNVPYSNVKE